MIDLRATVNTDESATSFPQHPVARDAERQAGAASILDNPSETQTTLATQAATKVLLVDDDDRVLDHLGRFVGGGGYYRRTPPGVGRRSEASVGCRDPGRCGLGR